MPPPQSIRITVKLFAYFRRHLPPNARDFAADIEVAAGATAAQVLRNLGVPLAECRLAMINGITHTDPPRWLAIRLDDGDVLAVLPNIH
jgi:molybdopterin converting factor small subunit